MIINFDWKLIYSLKNINENVNIYLIKYYLIGKQFYKNLDLIK